MKFNFSKSLYLLLVLPLFFASCSKQGPAGPAGAAGPQGPAGTAGVAGAPGTQGAQGNPGTANVIYSAWLDVAFKPLDTATNPTTGKLDTLSYIANIPAPQLVDSIMNKGEVKVYLNLGSVDTATIVALPFTTLYGVLISPYFSIGTISLVANADASTVTDAGKKYLQYRYIIIPGGTAAGRRPNGISWNNYAEVKKYLGLKD